MANASQYKVALEQSRVRTHAQNVESLRGLHPDSAREIAEISKSAWGREYLEKYRYPIARDTRARTVVGSIHLRDLKHPETTTPITFI